MNTFLSFIGYPHSMHRIASAILNANPNVHCSNRLDILNNFNMSDSKMKLFSSIQEHSLDQDNWKDIIQINHVPKNEITVIGDDSTYRNTLSISNNPRILGQFKQYIVIPIKFIHVVRNPFDSIASWARIEYISKSGKGIETTQEKEINIVINEFKKLNETISRLKISENILTINFEYLITRMHNTLEEMSKFLDIEFHPFWRDNIRNGMPKKPTITRKQVNWNTYQLLEVQKIIDSYEFLKGYNYDCGKCQKKR
jgi:hypothetical protein